ncbi:MAG TPA: APC family permease [Pseudonocardiaceae bacterium]|nr:APC family permease [Pseudonocardiaceae bacterium]
MQSTPVKAGKKASSISMALAANRLGIPSVVFFVMTAATPLTVVAGTVTTGYATTGLIGIPVAFIAIGIVLALFSVGYVAMAPYTANAGAFYAYISRGIAKPLGVGGAWVALVSYCMLQVSLYGGVGVAAAPVLKDWFGVSAPWWLIALVAWAIVAITGIQQVSMNGKILAVLLCCEVAVIVVFSFTDLFHPAHNAVSFSTLSPGNLIGSGVGALFSLAILGFVGFESAVVFSEESKDPKRTVRVATYLAVAIIAVLYAFASWAMSVATGPDKIVSDSQTQQLDLVFNLAAQHLAPALVDLGHLLFVTSMLAAMISFHNTTARYMFALGRERVLPASLGRTSRRTGSPIVGSLVQTVVGLVIILVWALVGLDPLIQLFFWLSTTGGVGILFLLVLTGIGTIVFFSRTNNGETLWQRRIAPIAATVLLLIVTYFAVTNFAVLLGVSNNSPLVWAFPVGFVVIGLAGVIWGLVLRARHPEVYKSIGLGAKRAIAEPSLGTSPSTESVVGQ